LRARRGLRSGKSAQGSIRFDSLSWADHIAVVADLLAPLGMAVTLAFAATMPYVVIIIGRRVFRMENLWAIWWPAISPEVVPAAIVMSGSSSVSRDAMCQCKLWMGVVLGILCFLYRLDSW